MPRFRYLGWTLLVSSILVWSRGNSRLKDMPRKSYYYFGISYALPLSSYYAYRAKVIPFLPASTIYVSKGSSKKMSVNRPRIKNYFIDIFIIICFSYSVLPAFTIPFIYLHHLLYLQKTGKLSVKSMITYYYLLLHGQSYSNSYNNTY